MMSAAVLCLFVVTGAALQRLSGTGVGLVVAPVAALLMGPVEGIVLTNVITTASGFMLTLSVRRDVEWRRWGVLCASASAGVLAGALLVGSLPHAWLQILVGGVVLLSLGLTVSVRNPPFVPVVLGGVIAGALGGFFNVTAGVAAAAMIIYALMTRWEHRRYAATMQPTFMTLGAMSLIAKAATGSITALDASFWLIPGVITAVLIGGWLGKLATRTMPAGRARGIALTLAGIGAISTIARGIMALG